MQYAKDWSQGGQVVNGKWMPVCGCKPVSWNTGYDSQEQCVAAWRAEGCIASRSRNLAAGQSTSSASEAALFIPIIAGVCGVVAVGLAAVVAVRRWRRSTTPQQTADDSAGEDHQHEMTVSRLGGGYEVQI
eukprot:Sspe_Gene.30267::Locus_14921_Transcript_1_1_Confidence_1.000_Length_656::g.30267::m.30267